MLAAVSSDCKQSGIFLPEYSIRQAIDGDRTRNKGDLMYGNSRWYSEYRQSNQRDVPNLESTSGLGYRQATFTSSHICVAIHDVTSRRPPLNLGFTHPWVQSKMQHCRKEFRS